MGLESSMLMCTIADCQTGSKYIIYPDGDYLLFYARTLGLCSQAGTKVVLGSSRRSSVLG